MSNDLISRKEAVELVIAEYDRFQANGGSYSGRHELDRVIKMLQNMPTAFDCEEMIKIIDCVNGEIAVGDKNALYWMAKLEDMVRKAGSNEPISRK